MDKGGRSIGGVFAAVSFAPFADILDAAFGGILGLRG